MKSKFSKRFSIKSLLILFTFLAVVCLFLEGYRDQIVHGKLTATVRQDYNLSTEFDIEVLEENLNSQDFIRSLSKQDYDHYRVFRCWNDAKHGFEVTVSAEGTFSKNIQVVSNYPIYAIRERKFIWGIPPYEQRFFADGPSHKGQRVAEQNRELYQLIFEQVILEIGKLKSPVPLG